MSCMAGDFASWKQKIIAALSTPNFPSFPAVLFPIFLDLVGLMGKAKVCGW